MGDRTERLSRKHQPGVARGEGREALYKALARIVARDGFDGVTFRSVAAEAGVTHGLASYHFGTRDAMIHEALSWAVRHSIEASRLVADEGTVETFASQTAQLISEAPEESVFQFELLLRSLRHPTLRDEVRKTYDTYIATVEQSLRQFDIHGTAIAQLVFAALDGLALQQLLYEEPARTREAIEALGRILRVIARGDRNLRAAPTDGQREAGRVITPGSA